jgi:hypothetical protein
MAIDGASQYQRLKWVQYKGSLQLFHPRERAVRQQ